MQQNAKQILLATSIIIGGFVGVFALSNFLEGNRPQLPVDYEDTDLSMNGSKLKGFALGFEGLLADWYWMRSLQYIGNKIEKSTGDIDIEDLRSLNPRLLYPYLDNATDLDPHFITAYSFGAVVLPAIDPQKAIALADKGIANNPNEWRLYQHLGYIYWKMKQYDKAAEIYEKGSEIAGAEPFMRMMAGAIRTEGGSRETARQIFQQMYDSSDDPMVRLTAERRLNQYNSADDIEAIDKSLDEFNEKNGRCAASLREILPMLARVRLPHGRDFRIDNAGNLVDPTGVPYLLDRTNCRVKLDNGNTGVLKNGF